MLSMLKKFNATKFTAGSETEKVFRILAYGDSYTAGWHNNGAYMTPYAPALEKELQRLIDNDTNDNTKVIVRHRGLSGWTAKDMVKISDRENIGLGALLDNAQEEMSNKNTTHQSTSQGSSKSSSKISNKKHDNPFITMCIIMVGRNDIGRMMITQSPESQESQESCEDIYNNIIKLHDIAHQKGIYTISLDIPPNPPNLPNASLSSKIDEINNKLQQIMTQQQKLPRTKTKSLTKTNDKMRIHVKFPNSFNSRVWDEDGLHMTHDGYNEFGTNIAYEVHNALKNWNKIKK